MTKKTKTQYPHLLHAINTIHKISEENACEGSKNILARKREPQRLHVCCVLHFAIICHEPKSMGTKHF